MRLAKALGLRSLPVAAAGAPRHGSKMSEDPQSSAPELSIIVVNWNTREITLECLQSALDETRDTRIEILVVDNGSKDGSAEAIAARFPGITLLAESENHGFAKANNIAAEKARGRHILLLNSDTIVLDRAIDRLMAFARATPQARVWGGRTLFGDRSLNPTNAWGRVTVWSALCFALGLTMLFPRSNLFNPEALGGWDRSSERQVDIVSGCFFLIEADLWRELGGFDPAFFMYGEEADLCARARALGARPLVTPEATIVHLGGASTTRISTVAYVFGAKVELARRSMGRAGAALVRWLLLASVANRRLAYRLAAMLRGGRGDDKASLWSEVWRLRHIWRDGPVSAADAASALGR